LSDALRDQQGDDCIRPLLAGSAALMFAGLPCPTLGWYAEMGRAHS
jgi:hypothetical protein